MVARVGSVVDVFHQGDVAQIVVRSGDGASAQFEVATAVAGQFFMQGDTVFMDRSAGYVKSGRVGKDGKPHTVRRADWQDPAPNRMAQAVVGDPARWMSQRLRGRIAAVQSGHDGWRCLARAALADGGCVEVEFTVTAWEPTAGMIVQTGMATFAELNEGRGDGAHPEDDTLVVPCVVLDGGAPWNGYVVRCSLWAEARYGIRAPMIDDSECRDPVRKMIEDQGARVRRIDSDRRGRVWTVERPTARGSAVHIKFPRESWQHVCESLGLDWPGRGSRWGENGPVIMRGPASIYVNGTQAAAMPADHEFTADDPWAIPPEYEQAMRDVMDSTGRRMQTLEEFRVPQEVGFSGSYHGIPVGIEFGLPRGAMAVVTASPDRGRQVTQITGLAS